MDGARFKTLNDFQSVYNIIVALGYGNEVSKFYTKDDCGFGFAKEGTPIPDDWKKDIPIPDDSNNTDNIPPSVSSAGARTRGSRMRKRKRRTTQKRRKSNHRRR
jgi:hypothetical protein